MSAIKKALAFNSIAEVETFMSRAAGDDEPAEIKAHVFDRAICDDAASAASSLIQPIPYVVFANFDHETSTISFVKYTRPLKNTEQDLKALGSFGFGGHVDDGIVGKQIPIEPFRISEVISIIPEASYLMTYGDYMATMRATSDREVREELGIELGEVLATAGAIIKVRTFYMTDTSVNARHLSWAMMVLLPTVKHLEDIVAKATAEKTEIENLCVASYSTAGFIPFVNHTADTTFAIKAYMRALARFNKYEHHLISNQVVNSIGRKATDLFNGENLEGWSLRVAANVVENVYSGLIEDALLELYPWVDEEGEPSEDGAECAFALEAPGVEETTESASEVEEPEEEATSIDTATKDLFGGEETGLTEIEEASPEVPRAAEVLEVTGTQEDPVVITESLDGGKS
jgi:hypothetical protein